MRARYALNIGGSWNLKNCPRKLKLRQYGTEGGGVKTQMLLELGSTGTQSKIHQRNCEKINRIQEDTNSQRVV